MAYSGYRVTYSLRWTGPKTAYVYQRFFRALYGYTQVVTKANGKRYVYHRRGVLTAHPFLKVGRTTVLVPNSALQPLLNFLKTGQNPAHNFRFAGSWTELVRYTIEETTVPPEDAAQAVLEALNRVHVDLVSGSSPAIALLESIESLSPEELYSLYYAIKPVISSEWFHALRTTQPKIHERVQQLTRLL